MGLQKAAGGEKARAAQGEKRIHSRPQGGGRPAFEMLPFGRVEDMPGPPRLFAGPDGQAGAPQPARLDAPAGAFDGGGQPEAEKPLFYDYDDMHRANMAEAGKLAGEALADGWGRIHGDGEHGLPPAYDQDAVHRHIIDQAAGPTVEPVVEKALNYLAEVNQTVQKAYEEMPDQPNISATEMDFRTKPQPSDRLPDQPNISATEMDFISGHETPAMYQYEAERAREQLESWEETEEWIENILVDEDGELGSYLAYNLLRALKDPATKFVNLSYGMELGVYDIKVSLLEKELAEIEDQLAVDRHNSDLMAQKALCESKLDYWRVEQEMAIRVGTMYDRLEELADGAASPEERLVGTVSQVGGMYGSDRLKGLAMAKVVGVNPALAAFLIPAEITVDVQSASNGAYLRARAEGLSMEEARQRAKEAGKKALWKAIPIKAIEKITNDNLEMTNFDKWLEDAWLNLIGDKITDSFSFSGSWQ